MSEVANQGAPLPPNHAGVIPIGSPEDPWQRGGVHKEEPTYSHDGVDLTLIRWMLSLTPSERLQVLQQTVQSLARLCHESSFT